MKLTRSQLKQRQTEYPIGSPWGGPAYGKRADFIFGGDDPPPPDYTPLANASKESAEIMAKLGQNQLDESRRQYGLNKATADPVVAAQLELMKQTKTQGDDYYNYMKEKQRPVEDNLNATALAGTSPDDKALRDAVSAKMAEMGGQQGADAKMLSEKYNQYAEALKTGNTALAESLKSDLAGIAGGVTTGMDRIGSKTYESLGSLGAKTAADMAGIGSNLDSRMSGIAGGLREHSAKYEGDIGKDIGLYTSGNSAIVDKYGKDIEQDVGNAIADTRAGQAQATNSTIRQALRYGIDTPAVTAASNVGNARMIAAAANGTRGASIDKYRGLVGQGINQKQNLFNTSTSAYNTAGSLEGQGALTAADIAGKGVMTSADLVGKGILTKADLVRQGILTGANMNSRAALTGTALNSQALTDSSNIGLAGLRDSTAMKQQGDATQLAGLTAARDMNTADDTKSWAKKLDVAGLYRGAPGASQGAYSLATSAGNSAVGNTMAPGQALQSGMTAGANTIGAGRTMLGNGLSTIAGLQSSNYNTQLSQPSDLAALGQLAGAAYGIYKSSKKLKTDKKHVDGKKVTEGLQRIPVDAWKYKKGVADGGKHVGPYAEDVQREFGDKAAPGGKKIDLISMNGIALAVGKNNANRLDRIERKIGLTREG